MRCEPGDMAVMIRAQLRENVGLFVRVLHRASTVAYGPDMPAWRVTPVGGGRIAGIVGNGVRIEGSGPGTHPDAWLRPIRPQPAADETLRDVPVDAGRVAA